MNRPTPESCVDCGVVLATRGAKYERAVLLSGSAYCTGCITRLTFTCEKCRRVIQLDDFEHGRAMTLLGSKYCEGCLESAVSRTQAQRPKAVGSPASGPPPGDRSSGNAWGAHRAHPRFVPPLACRMSVRRPGLRGIIGGDRLCLWVDVSEGGVRVILRGRFHVGDRLEGSMAHPSLPEPLAFEGDVRYAKKSRRYRDCTLVGVRFEAPSRELCTFIRAAMGDHPALTPAPVRRKSAPRTA